MLRVMKLTFVYAPVSDLPAALAYYRDTLGLDESWREGDHTVAFALPDTDVQIMVSVDTDPAGPMYIVDDAAAWVAAHPELTPLSDVSEIPDGAVVRYADPAGNAFYVFDQAGAE
jgi:catechol 2,3-dioxygenase-like lactoylglutathione lyase family enzyme